MITDVVCEQLFERKKEPRDYIMIVLIHLAVICLLVAVILVFIMGLTLLAPMGLGFGVFAIFLMRKALLKLRVEYEYCFVNGDLTIDKITGKSKRYRKAVISIRQVEEGGIADEAFFASHKKVCNFADCPRPENGIYIKAVVDGDSEYVVICPDARLKKAMRPYFKPAVQRVIYKDEIVSGGTK